MGKRKKCGKRHAVNMSKICCVQLEIYFEAMKVSQPAQIRGMELQTHIWRTRWGGGRRRRCVFIYIRFFLADACIPEPKTPVLECIRHSNTILCDHFMTQLFGTFSLLKDGVAAINDKACICLSKCRVQLSRQSRHRTREQVRKVVTYSNL